MARLIEWLEPTSIFQVVMVCMLFIMFFNSRKNGIKLKKIGKDGLEFTDGEVDLLAKQAELAQGVAAIREDLQRFIQLAGADIKELKEITTDIKNHNALQDLNILKIQIQCAESLETKLILYDEYKKKGGNSWIDKYVADYKDNVYARRRTDQEVLNEPKK